MNLQSVLFQELDSQEITKVVKQCLGMEKIKKTTLLKGGLFNTTYKIEIEDPHREIVLRIGPVNRQFLFPFEENLMKAEKYVYDLLFSKNIPCSKVIACSTSKNIIDRDFMIVEYIDSIPLNHETISQDTRLRIHEDVGRYITKMHSITNDKFGYVSEILNDESYETWEDFIISYASKTVKKCLEFDVFDKDTLKKFFYVFKKMKPEYEKVTTPSLLHTDLWDGNILVSKNPITQDFELTAIIDADRAIFGDVDFEFATPWMIDTYFLRGYGNYQGIKIQSLKTETYRLLINFFETFNKKVQYINPPEYETRKKDSILLLDSILKRL